MSAPSLALRDPRAFKAALDELVAAFTTTSAKHAGADASAADGVDLAVGLVASYVCGLITLGDARKAGMSDDELVREVVRRLELTISLTRTHLSRPPVVVANDMEPTPCA